MNFSPAVGIGLFVVFSMSLCPAVKAQELDSASQEALEKTQQLLTSPGAREEAFKADPNAKKAGDQVKNLGLKAGDQEQLYQMSSDMMGKMTHDAGGDASKMQEMMEKATKDPASFYEGLSADQKQKIKQMSEQIEPPKK